MATNEYVILLNALRKGFISLQDIQEVTAVLKEHPSDSSDFERWSTLLNALIEKNKLDASQISILENEEECEFSSADTIPVSVFKHEQLLQEAVEKKEAAPPIQDEQESDFKTIPPDSSESYYPELESSYADASERIGRFRITEELPSGGMGKLYKAYDDKLKRHVTVKVLKITNPEIKRLFIQEGQRQAKIRHINICEIYEAGEDKGIPYIAMQYIEGSTLSDYISKMTLQQKIEVMESVANALCKAHQAGVIHKDIKPKNIMIEVQSDGSLKPYVIDFGIAQESTDNKTLYIGTPAYMPPEQIPYISKTQKIDQRADIYSLGATLYELITGILPFQGNSSSEILAKVITEEPIAPSHLVPDCDKELSYIIMKCLKKDAAHRYESAKALADDLHKYLSHDLINGVKYSSYERIAYKARTHKAFVFALSITIVAIIAGISYGLLLKRNMSKENESIRLLDQQIEKIEQKLYHAYTLPLHDTRRETAVVRAIIKEIEEHSKKESYLQGPRNYAIGRGFLALNELDTSKHYLETAWKTGYRQPDVAYALGEVYALLYRNKLLTLEHTDNRELELAQKKKLEKEYRDPALTYLKRSHGATIKAPEFMEAQIAFLENNYKEALRKARLSFEQKPELYEAKKLEGDIFVALGEANQDISLKKQSLINFAKAESLYLEAIEIGRSYFIAYEDLCSLYLKMSWLEPKEDTSNSFAHWEKGLKSCEQALHANPESSYAHSLKSNILSAMASETGKQGQDPTALFQQAVASAETAFTFQPNDEKSVMSLAIAYWLRALYKYNHKKNPLTDIEKASLMFQKAIAVNPDNAYTYLSVANSVILKARYQDEHGISPLDSAFKAAEYVQKAIAINPKYAIAYGTFASAITELAWGNLLHDVDDPHAETIKVIKASEQALEITPNFYSPYLSIAEAYWIQAQDEMYKNINPAKSIQKGRDSLLQALDIGEKLPVLYYNLALFSMAEAQWFIKEHKNNPDLINNFPNMHIYKADVHRWKAEWQLSVDKSAAESITTGLIETEKALAIDPQNSTAFALQGVFFLLKVKQSRDQIQKINYLQNASKLLDKAMALNHNLYSEYLPYLKESQHLLSSLPHS